MFPEGSYLMSDDIPLAVPGTPIEGRADRADAYPVVVTSDADTAYRGLEVELIGALGKTQLIRGGGSR